MNETAIWDNVKAGIHMNYSVIKRIRRINKMMKNYGGTRSDKIRSRILFAVSSKTLSCSIEPNNFLTFIQMFLNRYFVFHSELSHDNMYLIQAVDQDLVDEIKYYESKGILNSTVLVVMSDRGSRFG